MLITETHDDASGAENINFLYQMAYCSVLRRDLSEQELKDLVIRAQNKNRAKNITGLLMMEDGLVIQWLEGKKEDVRELWAKLLEDQRHHCIVELTQRHFVTERLFPDWSMQPATRQELVAIVNSAREQIESGKDTPWAGAIATLCILIDPAYAQAYRATLKNQASAKSQQNAEVAT